ncbi:MAG: DUF1080 domain-containing protein [Phycisphaeraceae bacterium]
MNARHFTAITLTAAALLTLGCEYPGPTDPPSAQNAPPQTAQPATADKDEDKPDTDAAESLFDGETLNNWQITEFGGQGDVTIKDNAIHLAFGNGLTGIHWDREAAPPTTNYEIQLQAKRIEGNDFFCGLTFPVGEDHCSFIVGGWGGTVVGLSSLDFFDASQNETTTVMAFEKDQWYDIRVRVEPDRIQAWIDDESVVDVNIEDRHIGIRPEVSLSRPLGIAAWNTSAALRDIKLRKLD